MQEILSDVLVLKSALSETKAETDIVPPQKSPLESLGTFGHFWALWALLGALGIFGTLGICGHYEWSAQSAQKCLADFPAVFFHISHWYLSWNTTYKSKS